MFFFLSMNASYNVSYFLYRLKSRIFYFRKLYLILVIEKSLFCLSFKINVICGETFYVSARYLLKKS